MIRGSVISSTLACLALALALQGCFSSPPRSARPAPARVTVGQEIAMRAISLLGAPYKWGASGPNAFDCSGLVRFVHAQVGISVPRTAAEQFSAATPVELDRIQPGDLLFFRIKGRRVSHVAIYAGDGRFIHAPQTGRPVEFRELEDEYYQKRLVGAGRLFE
jgi:cell wall-associated NlpC family hydrolase